MSNLKGGIVISIQIWVLLSFRNTSREGSVIFIFIFYIFVAWAP